MKKHAPLKPLTPRQAQLAADHFPLALQIAAWRWGLLPPAVRRKITIDDLAGPAALGLCKGAARFNPRLKVPAEAYLAQRIKGEILDYLRTLDLYNRPSRARQQSGQLPPVSQVSEAAAARCTTPNPYAVIDRQIDAERISARYPWLALTTYHGNTNIEIGAALGVDPSRVSQHVNAELAQARARFSQEAH